MDNLYEQVLEYCLSLPGAYEDYPFGPEWMVFRHQVGRRCFAYLYERGGRQQMNLKCEPLMADFWRRAYPGVVTPGYHMNKTHWNTVPLDGTLPLQEILCMIEQSFDQTRQKQRKGAHGIGV